MSKFLNQIHNLPLVTEPLQGIGGQIKLKAEQFVVEEIPLYECAGEGEHVFVLVTRTGWTTRSLQKKMASLFDLRDADVGYAGLKDKHARATQAFSLHLPRMDVSEVGRRITESLPVEVHSVRRHRNKLKPGHLLGNRFRIVIVDPAANAVETGREIAALIQQQGLPNYYGEQRFGFRSDNALRGREVLLGGGPREKWLRRFLLSAFQAALFNLWLAERVKRGWFDRLLTGDVAKKLETGGLFDVEDSVAESYRFEAGEITYTGPIYGARMRWSAGEPGELEREVLHAADVTMEMLRKAGVRGSRRVARVKLTDLRIESHPEGLLLSVSLPKGAYATSLLREFMKEPHRFG